MSGDVATSSEGATVIKRDPVVATIRFVDEFAGEVTAEVRFTDEMARKVAGMNPSVARLYFGHENGIVLQNAIKAFLGAE